MLGVAASDAAPLTPVAPMTTAQVSRLETGELMGLASQAFAVRCSQDAVLATVCAELDRREDWRAERGDLARVRGWSNTSVSLTPRLGPTPRWPSRSMTCPIWLPGSRLVA